MNQTVFQPSELGLELLEGAVESRFVIRAFPLNADRVPGGVARYLDAEASVAPATTPTAIRMYRRTVKIVCSSSSITDAGSTICTSSSSPR